MKNLLIVALWVFSIVVVAQKSETRSLKSFHNIKVSQAIDVYLKKGDKESARVEITGGDVEDVVTEVTENTLRVKMRDSRGFFSKVDAKVYVTYVSLEKISASSASSVFSDGMIKANNLDINVSSAASVELSVEATSVMVDVSSAGDAVLEGKASKVEVEVSSGGEIDAYKLDGETVVARSSSGGDARISVSKDLDAHASSGGDIRYRGNPSRTNTQSSSGGSVKKSN
ncbi:MAG: head GIN domain-containing protein [Cyclobacteriaceae bacterium]